MRRRLLIFGKVSIVVCGLLAIAVASRLAHTQGSALALYYTVTAIVAGGLAGLFLLAFVVPQSGPTAAIIAIVINLLFTAWATLTMNHGAQLNLHNFNYPWHEYTIGAVGNILLFIAGLIATPFFKPTLTTGAPLNLFDWLAAKRHLPS
ncbi:MAG: hypothetical protein V4555_03885, partial [Acidobacteriota bacterium]